MFISSSNDTNIRHMNNRWDRSIEFLSGVSESELEVWKRELRGESGWRLQRLRGSSGESVSELLEFEEHVFVLILGVRESGEDLF